MKKIKLNHGKYAMVDDEDFEELNKHKWYYYRVRDSDLGYAVRSIPIGNGKQKTIGMHRVIMNTPEGELTDHKDRNGINNQKNNMRACDKHQNGMNRSGDKNTTSEYKGVAWAKKNKKWRAKIYFNGKFIHIGMFTCEKKAAKAYDKKAKELFGEYAYLNFK